MFTAVVLICVAGTNNPTSCDTVINRTFYPTYAECKGSIAYAVANGFFTIKDPTTGAPLEINEWYCINWNSDNT